MFRLERRHPPLQIFASPYGELAMCGPGLGLVRWLLSLLQLLLLLHVALLHLLGLLLVPLFQLLRLSRIGI